MLEYAETSKNPTIQIKDKFISNIWVYGEQVMELQGWVKFLVLRQVRWYRRGWPRWLQCLSSKQKQFPRKLLTRRQRKGLD